MHSAGEARLEPASEAGELGHGLIVIGIVIGSGIFVLPKCDRQCEKSQTQFRALGQFRESCPFAVPWPMPSWTRWGERGGGYIYLRTAYGPLPAFVCAWTLMLAVLPAGYAWENNVFDVRRLLRASDTTREQDPLCRRYRHTFGSIDCVGVKESARVGVTFTALKVAALLVLLACASSWLRTRRFPVFARSGGPVSLAKLQASL